MKNKKISRRSMLRSLGAGAAGALLAACQPKTVIVEKAVKETVIVQTEKEVEKIVKETVVVETEKEVEKIVKETVVVEKEVEKEVEKVVTATPVAGMEGRLVCAVNGVNQPGWINPQRKLAEAYRDLRPDVEIVFEGATGAGFSYPDWLGAQLASEPVYLDLVAANYQASYRGYLNLAKYRHAINPHTGRKWSEDYDWNLMTGRESTPRQIILSSYVVHCGWFYNKEMFAEAGIAAPPTTWPEWLEDCEKLKGIGVTPISVNNSYQLPQWNAEIWYDQFMREERYEFGGAQEGDWNWEPDIDGQTEFDPKDPFHSLKYTFSTQRWLNALKTGQMTYDRDEISTFIHNMGQIFNTTYCTEDLFVRTDSYLPWLQKETAIMNNGSWSLPTITQDMSELTEARREALALGSDVKIDPFEWGTFDNPSMVDALVDGPARAVESSCGPYWGIVEKDQAQTDLALDFMMFFCSPPGFQVWVDALIEDDNFRPCGPPYVKDIVLPAMFTEMFADMKMIGNAEIGWNQCSRIGPGGSQIRQAGEQLYVDGLQGKVSPADYAKQLQQVVMDGWEEILTGVNMTEAEIDHPERKPASI